MVPADKLCLVSRDDLLYAGYEGLIIAAQKFDPQVGVKFITYAYKWIDNAIKKELYEYLGAAALSLDDENVKEPAAAKTGGDDIEANPEVVIKILEEAGLTKQEVEVFCMIHGIGRDQIKNLRRIAGILHISEIMVRRIKQSAENKVRNSTS